MGFRDRREAGRQLAEQLLDLAQERPIVLALPRGGVPVAYEIARALRAPLGILGVRKLGAPANRERAVGAIAEDGSVVLDSDAARRVGFTQSSLDATLEREGRELRRAVERYRRGRRPLVFGGRTVIVVDDGLATGLTALAAVRASRDGGAARIIVATPVGASESVRLLGREADGVVCSLIPRQLISVGYHYRDFSPVSEEEAIALLDDAANEYATAAPEQPAL
jgi:putative phosphoribosyl transferase